MKEIKSLVKEQFLLVIEKQTVLVMFTPKEIWTQFDEISLSIKQQTYTLIKDLVKHGYLTETIDLEGKKCYSETSKLEDFRFDHCKSKATYILTKKLDEIKQQEKEKILEIQLTNELIKDIPELNFCLEKYINIIDLDIRKITKKKNNIDNIIKKIESCIY